MSRFNFGRWPHNILPDSPGDKLLSNAWALKISLIKYSEDDEPEECSCEIELKSTIEGEPRELLAKLIGEFRAAKGGAQ
jgi:hypothetical protein